MEGMKSEDGGRLVRESVEGAIVLRDVCRDGSKMKGRGIQGWEGGDTEGPKNRKETEILELAEDGKDRKKMKGKVEGEGEKHRAEPGLSNENILRHITHDGDS